MFGRSFSSRQVALSSLTSPTSDAAAPNVNVPPPFALSGASPSLHARHKKQHFLFLLKSIECLHRWHSHDEVRRVADRSSGILLKEGEREIGQVAAGSAWKFRGEDPTIPIRGVYLNLHMRPPILCEISPPTSIGGKAKAIPNCSCFHQDPRPTPAFCHF